VNISAILICATVTVFAFAVGEAIAPALSQAVKNVLLLPFVLIGDIYRNWRAVLRLLFIMLAWVVALIIAIVVLHGQS
jgi:hypothetical protein